MTLLSRATVAALRSYKRRISPLLPAACRFTPTCSEYAADCFTHHPLLRALWLSTSRVFRCNPFCQGGVDTVPPPAHVGDR